MHSYLKSIGFSEIGGKKEVDKILKDVVNNYDEKVVVEGVNVRTKHTKPRKAGEPGGLIKAECAIHASKANVFCPKCGKGVRTKVEIKKDGTKVRVCAKCNEEIK